MYSTPRRAQGGRAGEEVWRRSCSLGLGLQHRSSESAPGPLHVRRST